MNWDNRLDALGIKSTATPNAKWTALSVVYQDESQAQGNHIILFTVQDAQGKPAANVPCIVDWVGRDAGDVPTRVMTDDQGTANVPIYANLDINKLNGPYFAYVESQAVSDVVSGMGLPEHHHVNYLLTFGPKSTVTTPTPTPPTQTLAETALAAAKAVTWMPVNNGSALWNYAKANGLQDQQTDEIKFTYNGADYLVQVFNLGIVYVKVGDWGNIQVLQKESPPHLKTVGQI
ncbi:MAG: hypothetical protein WCF84_12875 [Anaerolineae bacterium]